MASRPFTTARYQFTPSAARAVEYAVCWVISEELDELTPPVLLMGLLAESESRAALILARCGVDSDAVRRRWPEIEQFDSPEEGCGIQPGLFSVEVQQLLHTARQDMSKYADPVLATEHLLLGLAGEDHETARWLAEQGLDRHALEAEVHALYGFSPEPLSVDELDEPTGPPIQIPEDGPGGTAGLSGSVEAEPPCPTPTRLPPDLTPVERIGVLRVIDAATNRTREGLRVVEDFVRFVLDDGHLTKLCKTMRHELAAVLQPVPIDARLASRETQADVGTPLTSAGEQSREQGGSVLRANVIRIQEGLRTLEEFSKTFDPDMAARLKQLRYQSYTLQRAVEITRSSIERLAAAKLYVLIDGGNSVDEFRGRAAALVRAGVDILQLRDKTLDDQTLLSRSLALREVTDGTATLFVMNDRPDLAALCKADGVHVGQEELSVKDARSIVGPDALIGVSTHSIDQARQAVLDGANYLGVGPMFPSGTKQFESFPGLEYLRQVAGEIRLPAFAIGGITTENLDEVLATGIARVAVSRAISICDEPSTVVARFLSSLKGA